MSWGKFAITLLATTDGIVCPAEDISDWVPICPSPTLQTPVEPKGVTANQSRIPQVRRAIK